MRLVVFFITGFLCLNSFAQQTVGVFQNDSTSLNGYTLISNLNATNTYLIDNCGDVVNNWTKSSFDPGPVVYLLDDGSLLKTCKLTSGPFLAGGSGGRLEKYNWNDSLMWEYDFDSPTQRQHHDAVPLPNGNILVLSWDLISLPQAKASGLDTNLHNLEVWSEKVVEIQPVGSNGANIIWEWRLWDHIIQDFDSTAANFGTISQNRQLVDLNYINNNGRSKDYFHANGLHYNPILDQVMISVRNYDEFWVIDHSTTTAQAATSSGGTTRMGGDILYRWGNPETYQQGTINDKQLFGQHHPNWIPAGYRDAGKIIVFNNGYNDTNLISKVQIIDPPVLSNGTYLASTNTPFGPLRANWSYNLPIFVDFVSGASRLENGNTLITSGPDGSLYELDSNDLLVWQYVSPLLPNDVRTSQGNPPNSNSIFRSYRYAAKHPAFNNKTFNNTGPLELNPGVSNCIIHPNPITGLADENKLVNATLIVPNPTTGSFQIRSSGFNNATINISIRDMSGRLVSSEFINDANGNFIKSFDLNRESKGVYFISIVDGESVINKKLIVQ